MGTKGSGSCLNNTYGKRRKGTKVGENLVRVRSSRHSIGFIKSIKVCEFFKLYKWRIEIWNNDVCNLPVLNN